MQYLRESFFRGESWIDRDHVQREAVRWCFEVAGTRIHGTTRRRPLAVFENVEKPALHPLEHERFDPPTWAHCKVHPDHHIQFQKGLYSAPTRHVGKRVWVRGDSKLVRIYVEGELVKTHKRVGVGEGKRSTDYADYPEELAAACRRALYFELYNVKRVEQIIKNELERDATTASEAPRGQLVLLPTRFLRPTDHFNHTKENPTHVDRDQATAQDPPQAPEALGHAGDAPGSHRLRPKDEAP